MLFFKKLWGDLLNLIYPGICVACGNNLPAQHGFLCPSCLLHIPRTNFHLEQDNFVEQLFWGRTQVERATAFMYFTKGSKYQALIHQLKYKGLKEIGYSLGKMFGEDLVGSSFIKADMIVPVPLHLKKKRKRGFNQSEWIAKGIGEGLDIPVKCRHLKRNKNTATQTKKSRFERWQNVEEAFVVNNKNILKDKRVILVDDVVTTGATLEACANIIQRETGAKVYIATLGVAWN
jgi:ComF family protein